MSALLKLDGINVFYGAIHALKDVSLEVDSGQIIALLGANGAGKTTTLRTISRLISLKSGSIFYDQKDLAKQPAHSLIKQGIAHVPEGRGMFPQFTVEENLKMGAYSRHLSRKRFEQECERIFDFFPRLSERFKQQAGSLSGGEQQMVTLGRALIGRPRLIMLDELSLGLAPLVVYHLLDVLKKLAAEGTAVLLVEQNVTLALTVADYGYVLEQGRISLEGTGVELRDNPHVQSSYLGLTS